MILTPTFTDGALPLAEYPRPQFRRDSYLPLNGEWEYAIRKSPDLPKSYDGNILVPYPPESAASVSKPPTSVVHHGIPAIAI